MLTRAQKESQVSELREKLGRATSVFVADYRGVSVQEINELRARLRREGDGSLEYRVTKNSVLRRAVADSPTEVLRDHFTGPSAIAISFAEPVALAKALVEYAKDHECFELKGGFLDGRALGNEEIATLATLPSLDALRGKLVGLLAAPATQLVRLLTEPGAQLARLVEARRSALGDDGDEG